MLTSLPKLYLLIETSTENQEQLKWDRRWWGSVCEHNRFSRARLTAQHHVWSWVHLCTCFAINTWKPPTKTFHTFGDSVRVNIAKQIVEKALIWKYRVLLHSGLERVTRQICKRQGHVNVTRAIIEYHSSFAFLARCYLSQWEFSR